MFTTTPDVRTAAGGDVEHNVRHNHTFASQ